MAVESGSKDQNKWKGKNVETDAVTFYKTLIALA